MPQMRFEGTDTYVATEDLMMAVNAAVTLGRPLLIKGEPGTGKTMLAIEIARALQRPLIQWHIKSTTKAQQGLYEYDAVARLRDSQLGDEHVNDIRHLVHRGVFMHVSQDRQAELLLNLSQDAQALFHARAAKAIARTPGSRPRDPAPGPAVDSD